MVSTNSCVFDEVLSIVLEKKFNIDGIKPAVKLFIATFLSLYGDSFQWQSIFLPAGGDNIEIHTLSNKAMAKNNESLI